MQKNLKAIQFDLTTACVSIVISGETATEFIDLSMGFEAKWPGCCSKQQHWKFNKYEHKEE